MNKKRIAALLCSLGVCVWSLAQQTEVKYLSGTDANSTVKWDFLCSKGMNSGKWRKIAVPSCWEQQGFGAYTYGRYYKTKGLKPSDETGRYRYAFKVPDGWNGRKVEIVFEGVMTDATVTVNGKQAGAVHQGGFTAFSYDITNLIDYGKKNQLEVYVEKQSQDKSINAAERRADWWLFGGIYRPVYMRALPKTHIERIAVDARHDGRLTVNIFTEGINSGYTLQTSVSGLGTKTSPLVNEAEQTVSTEWEGAKTWDPEHPNLYTLNLKLISPNGTVVHEINQRIGFRTVEFRQRNGFYLNGKKLLVKGINRHCFYPETGRTTGKRQDIEDVKLVKAMNANAIRSHYPPDTHLLDACDSLGVLYFDELPGWQDAYNTTVGTRILSEMISHDVNHPCIFVWSNGNEGGNNRNLDALFATHDPQHRHVIHPWACWGGVDTHHYPAYQTGAGRLANGYQVFMPTEFLHGQYDKGAGASLDDFWSSYSRNPMFAGGFIWALIDEGIMRTDRNGEIDTDGANGPDGIVSPHREKEGSWYTIRDVWSPIQIAPMTVTPSWNGKFIVSNRYLYTNLSECSMTYRIVSLAAPWSSEPSKVLNKGQVTMPNIESGESGTAQISPSAIDFSNGDVLELVALNANRDTINTWAYIMKYADEYFVAHKPLSVQSQSASVSGTTLEANGIKAMFNPDDGMLATVSHNGKDIPFGNGPLPIGMKMKLKTITPRMDGGDAMLIMHYTGAADSIVWRMTPGGLLGMDAVVLNSRNGKKFDGAFYDSSVGNLGFSFSYPETDVKAMRWLGKGPYRVWRNRQRGANYGIWQKDYNNTVTGESTGKLVYPEFKGYHANLYWAQMQSANAPFTVYSETDGLYYRVFTPEEPKNRKERTMEPFPAGDLSFLLEIPAMRSYKPIEQLGPSAQPSNIRISPGDDGLRIKLWFDFK